MIEWVGPGVDRLCPSFAVDTTGTTLLWCNYSDDGTFDVGCIVKWGSKIFSIKTKIRW